MGCYNAAVCRLCRREGVKLFLKGNRCHTQKCTLKKRERPPGMHNWRRSKLSEYGAQLREKQKAKRMYGIFDRQFKNYFYEAERQKGNTGENLLILLERRLDNVIYRSGFALSRPHARQIIRHGHITVNKKKVDIPSFRVSVGDVIAPSGKEKSQNLVNEALETVQYIEPPSWLEVTQAVPEIKVIHLPTRDEIPVEIQEHLIVELCSK